MTSMSPLILFESSVRYLSDLFLSKQEATALPTVSVKSQLVAVKSSTVELLPRASKNLIHVV